MAEQEERIAAHSPAPPHRSVTTAVDGQFEGHGISINEPDHAQTHREHPLRHSSEPSYHSPVRHHRRTPSRSRAVKETLDAQSSYGSGDDDAGAVHRINQYIIKQEIGRGSFGAVHLAVDQFGNEYAIKEFSKTRLRKRAQSNLLRNPQSQRRHGSLAAGQGFNSPLHRRTTSERLHPQEGGSNNSLSLIKEEIAIMKKLNHNNVVTLLEVLDDPDEDSLYMVLEMCKKGVVMKVGLDEQAEPYPEEACRCWFRDMILGIEYLHAQGIVHRDIKPDNCLITNDDVLKIVDFGVSEMFEKESDMSTAKSAGSPAFMPPELCVARHGIISGKAADIWSMGVTLYCLRYGRIPFEKANLLDLYNSIRDDDFSMDGEQNTMFKDLMARLLDKNPDTRIKMDELRNHAWVTRQDTDPLLSAEENCADLVDPPTEAEMENAITGNMAHLMAVMRAVKRFKDLLFRKRPDLRETLLGKGSHVTAPPHSIRDDVHRVWNNLLVTESDGSRLPFRSKNKTDEENGAPLEQVQSPEQIGDDKELQREAGETQAHFKQREESLTHPVDTHEHLQSPRPGLEFDGNAKGHAHDPLSDTLFLDIGPGTDDSNEEGTANFCVSESPPAVDTPIYEQAYQDEMKRIMQRRQSASMYLTRRVEHREDIRNSAAILDAAKASFHENKDRVHSAGRSGLASLVEAAKSLQSSSDDVEPASKGKE